MVAPSIVLGAHYTIRGDSMDRMGLHDGEVVAVRATPDAKSGEVVVAQFGDGVTRKCFVQRDARRVELRPDSHNTMHETIHIDMEKHILQSTASRSGRPLGNWGHPRKADAELKGRTPCVAQRSTPTRYAPGRGGNQQP